MADSAAEWVKFWGGLAGLGTAAFTLWDRAIRSRPWVEPHIALSCGAPLGMPEIDAPPYLRVHNPGSRTVGIRTVQFYGRRVPCLALTVDVGRDVHRKRLLPIPAGKSRLFEVMWVVEPGQDPEAAVWIVIRWRPLAAVFPRVPLLLRTSVGALIRLQDAEAQRARDEEEARRLRTAPVLIEPEQG
ncbi:hypothetical protein Mrad2831_6514 (plasmid) [Methylobacterium radiotolerans JCM 2831]|uniref:Uncharacterized protein n=1 Tax=Methylobacterium radiotolerans (strain ATCC 27329 / DSM 1819 / JCM 2831 / NBRC 15690 / NCIMB 10815 / 0-1) TaxID=426355 RepID=B1MAA1_METRJ|nr:hypothetical protein Mrad2831_6514 [Methylobacterium radiotolerans JCM 2831]GEN01536.1 hypothetical protein MRA01_60750 [Methylobacterium radiotolerans]